MRLFGCFFGEMCEIFLLLLEMLSVHVSDAQLEITSMYCQVVSQDVAPSHQLSSRLHHWNTLLFVGLFTAKVTNYQIYTHAFCLCLISMTFIGVVVDLRA